MPINYISQNLLGLGSWMSFRFSNERYAQKFWKAEWRQIPAFFLQGEVMAGLHIPAVPSLIARIWSDLTGAISDLWIAAAEG